MRTILSSRMHNSHAVLLLLSVVRRWSSPALANTDRPMPRSTRVPLRRRTQSCRSSSKQSPVARSLSDRCRLRDQRSRFSRRPGWCAWSPGQTDLKSAPAIQLSDVQVGDRLLAAGIPSDDGKSLAATTAVVMKKSDVAEKQQHDREEWQKNGVGGVVKSVDAAAGTITLSTGTLAANVITVHVSKDTIIRRYAAELGEVRRCQAGHAGPDEGRRSTARAWHQERRWQRTDCGGDRLRHASAAFPATLISTDTANNTITVTDLVD